MGEVSVMGFLATEKANLEQDVKSLYAYVEHNWKRILGWYATYYLAHHLSPAASVKLQAILKAAGIGG